MISSESSLIKKISDVGGMLPAQVAAIARTSPLRYKSFAIRKRNGGIRTVAQPAREVKFLQSILKSLMEPLLPFHESIAAYRPGDSIKKNALRHSNSRFLLKMDFVNFFPSITARDVGLHLQKYCPRLVNEDDVEAFTYICCWAENRSWPLRLCIGAPSSPWLSNSILFDIDSAIQDEVSSLGVTYSRYADDLTFSCSEKGVLGCIPNIVDKIISSADYPRLSVNHEKTIHASRATNRTVTGIVLTPGGDLSVGRERKRQVRAMHHKLVLGVLNEEKKEELEGLINFIESIEPGFRLRLSRKTLPRTG